MKRVNFFILVLFLSLETFGQQTNPLLIFNQEKYYNSEIKIAKEFSNGDLVFIGQNTLRNSEKQNIFILSTSKYILKD